MRMMIEKGLALLALLLLFGTPVAAQDTTVVQSQVLTVDSERLFASSDFGLRIAAEIESRGKELEAENRQKEAALIAEEKALTAKRPTLTPEAFRALADAFDEKVERIRGEQNSKTLALTQARDVARRQFLIAARPVLEKIMLDTGAAIIVERRSVFLSLLAIDITELAIERLNAEIGDGSALPNPDQGPAQQGADPK